jgi:hypothetical protein
MFVVIDVDLDDYEPIINGLRCVFYGTEKECNQYVDCFNDQEKESKKQWVDYRKKFINGLTDEECCDLIMGQGRGALVHHPDHAKDWVSQYGNEIDCTERQDYDPPIIIKHKNLEIVEIKI